MRIALHTHLRAGAEIRYEVAHTGVPTELEAAIRAAGTHEWTIWRSGQDLFHVIDCDDYPGLLRTLRDLPVNIAWQQQMADLLEVSHDYSAVGSTADLPVVWHLARKHR